MMAVRCRIFCMGTMDADLKSRFQRSASRLSSSAPPAWHAGQTQYFPPAAFDFSACSRRFFAPSAPKIFTPCSDFVRAMRLSTDVTSSASSFSSASAAFLSPSVPTAARYASPAAFASGQQDGAANFFDSFLFCHHQNLHNCQRPIPGP